MFNFTTAILITKIIIGEHMEYLSSDSIDKSETIESCHFQTITTEFLYSLMTSGLPNHCIKLKIGTPIMLLRNLDQTQGLCNGTRLIITRLAKHVIAAEIISGKNSGHMDYIPRMSMSPSQSPWPFKLLRRQFPSPLFPRLLTIFSLTHSLPPFASLFLSQNAKFPTTTISFLNYQNPNFEQLNLTLYPKLTKQNPTTPTSSSFFLQKPHLSPSNSPQKNPNKKKNLCSILVPIFNVATLEQTSFFSILMFFLQRHSNTLLR